MNQAEMVRQHVIARYIDPARARGELEVSVRAGDVHQNMGLRNALPAVCSAIGSKKFFNLAGVTLVSRSGPANSTTEEFLYRLVSGPPLSIDAARKELQHRYTEIKSTDKIAAFSLKDGREIALQLEKPAIRLWVEASNSPLSPLPDTVSVEKLCKPDERRNSNLPSRLKHNPPEEYRQKGFPVSVKLLATSTTQGLMDALDWYEGRYRRLQIDRSALEKLKAAFLKRFPDFRDFTLSEGGYWEEERQYKQIMLGAAQRVAEANPALSEHDLGQALLEVLLNKPSNLLGWRMQGRLAEVRKANPGTVEEASGQLARSTVELSEAVAVFVDHIWPFFAEGRANNLPYGDIRAIPSMILALAKPSEALAVRYTPLHKAGKLLLGRPLFANAPLSAEEYADVLELAQQLFTIMRDEWGWKPRDMWDVQGFLWVTCNGVASTAAPDGEDDLNTIVSNEAQRPTVPPTNLILYGPPGTGKTYETAVEAVRLCDGTLPKGGREELMARYRELLDQKRIEFVTFHQAYGYEDFVEGLRPETGSGEEGETAPSGGFRLVPRSGVFRRIAERARANKGKSTGKKTDLNRRQAFKMSLGRSWAVEDDYLFEECIQNGYVLLGWGGNVDWSDRIYERSDAIRQRWREIDPDANGLNQNIKQIYTLRSWMKTGDLVVVSDGNMRFRAIGEVVGEYRFVAREEDHYYHQRPVRWLWVDREGLPRETIYQKGFSQVSLYKLASEQLIWPALEQIVSGAEATQASGPPDPYVLIIDEINRANISKVFGELITLLEPDKRLGTLHELKVSLPYSGDMFGVPTNLHIIGTMNTADRSIALLDTALRRRFRFRELMPQPELLENIGDVDIGSVLSRLNQRIEYLFDRDHQIGHSYFMNCPSRADLDRVMRDCIIPLLAEYFYDDWEKIRKVLNERRDNGAFIHRERLSLLGDTDEASEYDQPRWRYTVKPDFTPDAYEQLAK